MDLAAIILSTISLLISIPCLVLLVAQRISSHKVQFVPLDDGLSPKKQMESFMEQFREIGERSGKPKDLGDDV